MEKEIYIDNIKETSLIISESKVDSVKMKDITKKGVRVYDNGLIGVSGAVGDINIDELTENAKLNLDNKIEYPCELTKDINLSLDASKKIVDDREFVKEGEELLDELSKVNSDFIFSNKIILQERKTLLTNSKNLKLEYKDRALEAGIVFKEKASANIMDGYVEYTGRDYNRKDFIGFSNMILEGYRNKAELPTQGKMPVAVSFNGEGAVFINKFLTDLNARQFMCGGSIFSDKIGKKVFSDDFTLRQTRNPKDVYLEPFFDMEGTVNSNHIFTLIENGVIKTPYTDKQTAAEYNLKNTGSATAEYDGVPQIGAPSLAIKQSEKTVKELFAGDIGIFVYITSGGDFTSSGEFGAPVQLAFLYDGEKILGRLPQLQISSDIYKMFNENYRGVASNSIFKGSNDKVLVMDMDVNLI